MELREGLIAQKYKGGGLSEEEQELLEKTTERLGKLVEKARFYDVEEVFK